MSTLTSQPTNTDAAFLDELNAARREAIAVLRSVLASLIPKPGSPPPPSLALLREARLAACDILALKPPAASTPFPSPPDTPPPSPAPRASSAHAAAPASPSDTAPFNPVLLTHAAHAQPSAPRHTHPAPPHPMRSRASESVQALLGRLGAPP